MNTGKDKRVDTDKIIRQNNGTYRAKNNSPFNTYTK